jgi:hypothetical protein
MVSRAGFIGGMSLTVTASSSPMFNRTLLRLSRHIHNGTASFSLDDAASVIYGESPAARTIYTVVSLVCMSLLAGMLGKRAQLDKWRALIR